MSESKSREKTDPNYGRIPKVQPSKGLVISNPMKLDVEENRLEVTGGLNPKELRSWILYWDKLVWPTSNAMHVDGGQDEEWLIKEKILTRPRFNLVGQSARIVFDSYVSCFLNLDKKEPGVWALSQGESSLLLKHPSGLFVENEGLTLELLRALPTPAEDVPLNEILEFKERRKDELLAFRAYTDKLVQEIQKSPESTEEMKRVLKDVDDACADLLKLGGQWQCPVTFADFKCSFNLNVTKAGGAAFTGYTAASFLGFGLPVSAAVAAASGLVSAIDIKADILGFQSPRKPQSPFQYCVEAHRELV